MLCNYLNNIYVEHIHPNLIDDEVKYSSLIKDKLIELIVEFNQIEYYDDEILLHNNDYQVGFAISPQNGTCWMTDYYIVNKLPYSFNNRNFKFIKSLVIELIIDYKINNISILDTGSPFYHSVCRYMNNKYN